MNIPEESWPYLKVQKGALSFLTFNRKAWVDAYRQELFDTYENVFPFLPPECDSILDVGGGVGGIDVLLAHHYDPKSEVAVLDGKSDAPIVDKYAHTFNDLEITRRFLKANYVDRFTPIPANKLPEPRPFDLIVSFASWCFHYGPEHYLSWVHKCCRPGTILILEVRRNRPEWHRQLHSKFTHIGTPLPELKFDRMVFRA